MFTRRRLLIAALVVGLLGGVWYVNSRPNEAPTPDPVALSVGPGAAVGDAPTQVTVAGETAYVTSAASLEITRVDVDEMHATGSLSLGAVPAGVVVAGGSIWVGFAEGNQIVRIDEGTFSDPEPIRVGGTPQSLFASGESIFVATLDGAKVVRIDAATGSIIAEYEGPGQFPSAVAVGFGYVWVTDVVDDSIYRFPEAGGEPTRIPVGKSPTSVAIGDESVWIGNFGSGTVSKLAPDANHVSKGIDIGGVPAGLATGDGLVWVTDQEQGNVIVINEEAGAIIGEVEVGPFPQGIASYRSALGGAVVVVQGLNQLRHVGVAADY